MSVPEIACDESGYEGDKLIDTSTDVFAHASVRLDADAATACIRELRDRIRSPATEYKAGHLLRAKHRLVLEWFLGPSGPLPGNGHVFLIDKVFFVLRAVVDLLIDDVTLAATLYRDGPGAFGPQRWHEFLVASNDLIRAKAPADPVETFLRTLAGVDTAGVGDVAALLRRARPRAEAWRAGLDDSLPAPQPFGPTTPLADPISDPLVPAITRAVAAWATDTTPVMVIHDRQNTLSERRIARLGELPGLAGLRLVESFGDPRVQVADVLAGTARSIASAELNGRGDPLLTSLLRPYVDQGSIWGDELSWRRLTSAPAVAAEAVDR